MLKDSELQNRAMIAATAAVRTSFHGDYQLVPDSGSTRWDPIIKRQTFSQSFSVWRNIGRISITISTTGEVIAFSDQSRLQKAVFVELSETDIRRICHGAGILGPLATVADIRQGQGGVLLATLVEPIPERPRLTRIVINPSMRLLASFEVELT